MSRRKIFLVIILILLTAVLAAVFWGPASPLVFRQGTESLIYNDQLYNFSFQYPNEFVVNTIEEGEIKIVRVENRSKTSGCQVTVSGFKEDLEYISTDRIHQDLPDLVINSEEYKTIALVTKVFKFTINDAGNKSLEAWFLKDKVLYQISCLPSASALLDQLIFSWKFD